MSGFSERITLIEQTFQKDAVGNLLPTDIETTIWANPFTISFSAYATSAQSGIKPDCEFQVHTCDYDGQPKMRIGDVRYSLVKSTCTGDYTRLVYSREVADE